MLQVRIDILIITKIYFYYIFLIIIYYLNK